MPLILIAGTGTEVGKTFVASAAARQLRHQSIAVVARKPVQSFASDDHETDADVLAVATGEQPHTVCPSHRWLPVPMAPPMAAHALGWLDQVISLEALAESVGARPNPRLRAQFTEARMGQWRTSLRLGGSI